MTVINGFELDNYPDLYGDILHGHRVYKIVFWSIFGVYTLYIGVTFLLYLYYALRVHDKALLERSLYLTCLQVFFGYTYCINSIFHSSILGYPCYINIWLIYFCYVPWSATICLTMLRYYTRKQTGEVFVNEMPGIPVGPEGLSNQLKYLQAICAEDTTMFVEQQSNSHQNISDVAPFLSALPQHEESMPQKRPCTRQHRRSSVRDIRMVEWRRRFSSSKFVTYVIAAAVVVVITLMIFFTIFSRKMSLKHPHYNCDRGWEFYPIIVFNGIFNVLLCPAFAIIAWSQQDGYGIRTSLVICSTLGVCFWTASLTWRLIRRRATIFISGSLFFLAQMIFVYTCTVVVPLVVSIRLERRKRIDANAGLTQNESNWVWSTLAYRRDFGSSRPAFMEAIQDSVEYSRIKRFAQSCFCEELVLFLDIHASLKQVILANVEANPTPQQPTTTDRLVSSLSPVIKSVAVSRIHTAPCFNNRYTSRSRTLTLSTSLSQTAESCVSNCTFANYSAGILETLQQAFPDRGFNGSSVVPESLRSTVTAIIRTFILPESVLAINATDDTVAACRAYLAGNQLCIAVIDRAKDQVLDLLYNNVYMRIKQNKA